VGFIYAELAFVTTREALYCVGGGGISISVVRLFTRLFFFVVVVVCFSPVLVSFYAGWGSFNIVVVSFFLVLDTFRGGVVFFLCKVEFFLCKRRLSGVLLPTNLPVLHLAYRFSVLRCGIYIWQLGSIPSSV